MYNFESVDTDAVNVSIVVVVLCRNVSTDCLNLLKSHTIRPFISVTSEAVYFLNNSNVRV